ncbi:Hypothetical predicted protein [Cloeon dipterum]|uniref:ZAD domain-containing protein n=1 Tax=Cloeon dipterum TaxID=197152 RepID=A0A8S1C1K2_9INSE|nr:Hypothetical predicted protein [Cloeon dipterum]
MLALPSDAADPLAGLCRVCAADGEPVISIFDHDAVQQQLQHKISVCLRILVNETDLFPNTLCGPCAARLDVSYELVQRCTRGQRELHRRLQAAGIAAMALNSTNKDCEDSDCSSQGPTYTTLEPMEPDGTETMDCGASSSSGWSSNLGLLADAVEHQSKMEASPSSSQQLRTTKELCCEFCSKVFHHMGDLNKHRRKHTGERPYPCHECDRRFSHISNLLRHSKIHSGERPFKCDSCQRSFNRSDKLMSHVATCSRRKSN